MIQPVRLYIRTVPPWTRMQVFHCLPVSFCHLRYLYGTVRYLCYDICTLYSSHSPWLWIWLIAIGITVLLFSLCRVPEAYIMYGTLHGAVDFLIVPYNGLYVYSVYRVGGGWPSTPPPLQYQWPLEVVGPETHVHKITNEPPLFFLWRMRANPFLRPLEGWALISRFARCHFRTQKSFDFRAHSLKFNSIQLNSTDFFFFFFYNWRHTCLYQARHLTTWTFFNRPHNHLVYPRLRHPLPTPLPG
jgi:hypothetical protein